MSLRNSLLKIITDCKRLLLPGMDDERIATRSVTYQSGSVLGLVPIKPIWLVIPFLPVIHEARQKVV